MTAGSLELRPCLVPPIGLSAAPTAPPSPPSPPNPNSLKKVCRNLFGNYDSGSIEAERRADELERMNNLVSRCPIETWTPITTEATTTTTTTEKSLPDLIQLEMQQHAERRQVQQQKQLQKEKCNSEISVDNVKKLCEIVETTPKPQRSNKLIFNNAAATTRTITTTTRNKPYKRQGLLTECFTVRKIPQNVKSMQLKKKIFTESANLQEFRPETTSIDETLNHHHHAGHQAEEKEEQEHKQHLQQQQ